jgi:tRNA/tmRNA/rRNA uracil-C5-methylase (TrmA/RlmC/RlmD family)
MPPDARDAVPDTFTVEVERLTYGPDALAHHGRCVVFVPFAAPGDRALVATRERRRGYVRADVHELLEPGPRRTTPFCEAFGRCGGCQWQHVATDAQREAKRAVVAEQLARLGGLRDVPVDPVRSAGPDRGYRGRIALAVTSGRVGYHRARSHDLVPIDTCPIAVGPVADAVRLVAEWLHGGAPAATGVALVAGPRGVVVVCELAAVPTAAERAAAEAWCAATTLVQGLVLHVGPQRLVVGDVSVHVPLEADFHLDVPADAFSQVNPAMNPVLVATVLELARPAAGTTVIDCYAGAGNFALPLARRGASVLAIEASRLAVDAGRANAARARLANVRFVCGDVAAALADAPRGHLDLVVLDPPRRGAAPAIAPIARHGPARIVYVSCDPATLARDARALVATGYRLGRVQPLDLFPQTYHVETVAEFELT